MRDGSAHHDLTSIWRGVTEELRVALPPSTFELWIVPLRPVSIQGDTLYVAAPGTTHAWVERRYSGTLEAALRRRESFLERLAVVRADEVAALGSRTEWTAAVESLPIDPRHTFERFVISDANRLAHAAALAVAELPGEAYNPLFLHGPPGLGKTHLLGAICDYLRRQRPDLNLHYTTAERFTTEFVGALRRDGPERFKQRYRGLDALLIDDVQALEGKDHTQEEFVHTFNALHVAGKQIVLSSDRPPEALARLAERLRDRFQWGLTTQLAPPDLRARTTLAWRMVAHAPIAQPEPSAIREVASLSAGNVRRLEGAMTRVLALSSLLGEPLTPALVRRALGSSPQPASGREDQDTPSVTAIQEAACSVLTVSRQDLLSAKRTTRVNRARQLAIYLTRELTPSSLAEIARQFNRDRSTILHAIRAVAGRLEPGSETAMMVERARQLVQITPGDLNDPDPGLPSSITSPPPPSATTTPGTSR